jgi:HD domain
MIRPAAEPAQGGPGSDRGIPEPLARELPAALPENALRLIERAYQFAAYRHRGRRRRSGDPYVSHSVAVATILARLGTDHEMVCAALLHDVIEDTGCTRAELRAEFGETITHLVCSAMAFGWPEFHAWEADPAAADQRALMLRLADRLHNMRTVRFLSAAKQRKTSAETLRVFAPLAHRLGLEELGRELEDIARATLQARPLDALVLRARPAAPGRRRVSGRTLTIAAVLLPAAARARWLEEWLAELNTLPAHGRARFTAQLLSGMPRLAITLRRPLTGQELPDITVLPLRLLRYVLVSNVRTWSVLLPFVAWMAIETGQQNIGDALTCLITVPPVLAAGVEWLRRRLGISR